MQSTIALSTGESENYALLRSSAHALGIKDMLNDWRCGVKFKIHICATAARQEACLLGKAWRKLDMLTCSSCGYNKPYGKDG